jgi:predicted DNA binding CopG/RHH family protein
VAPKLELLDVPNDASLGSYMKQPKLSDLKIDVVATKKTRSMTTKAKKVKITINIEEDILNAVRDEAETSGVPYQTSSNHSPLHFVLYMRQALNGCCNP